MSERTAKAARRKASTEGTPTAPPEVPPEVPSAEDQDSSLAHPAVIIMRIPGDQPGNENLQIIPLNGLDPLAIPTLLELAIKIKKTELGIGDQK